MGKYHEDFYMEVYKEENYLARLMNHTHYSAILNNDLNLILNHNFEIYIAVDFHDIFQFCFFNLTLNENFQQKIYKKEELLRKQISRSILFFMMEDIYKKPILLLPPYVAEANEFIDYYLHNNHEYFLNRKKTKLPIAFQNLNSKNEYRLLIRSLRAKSQESIFFLDNDFLENLFLDDDFLDDEQDVEPMDGIKMFGKILRFHITTDPSKIFLNCNSNHDTLDEYNSIRMGFKDSEDNELKEIIQKIRPSRFIQNRRDAVAIHYIRSLNNKLNRYNKATLLVSSAEHMQQICKNYNDKFEINIKGRPFVYLRDLEFFYHTQRQISELSTGDKYNSKVHNEIDNYK
jgi:hypothetical protein